MRARRLAPGSRAKFYWNWSHGSIISGLLYSFQKRKKLKTESLVKRIRWAVKKMQPKSQYYSNILPKRNPISTFDTTSDNYIPANYNIRIAIDVPG